MAKRHNRKRTRSRPRHRDSHEQDKGHPRSVSIDTVSPSSASHSSLQPYPFADMPANHWRHTCSAWQNTLDVEPIPQHILEMERIRYFGGLPGEEEILLEPMLQVVMQLFDGNIDFDCP